MYTPISKGKENASQQAMANQLHKHDDDDDDDDDDDAIEPLQRKGLCLYSENSDWK